MAETDTRDQFITLLLNDIISNTYCFAEESNKIVDIYNNFNIGISYVLFIVKIKVIHLHAPSERQILNARFNKTNSLRVYVINVHVWKFYSVDMCDIHWF